MKKILMISLLSLTLGLTACGNKVTTANETIGQTTAQMTEQITEQSEKESITEETTTEQATEKNTELETTTDPVATEESVESATEPTDESTSESETPVPSTEPVVSETPSPESTPAAPESTPETDVPETTTVSTSEGGPDKNGNTWYEKNTWTASNGYALKITDQSALVLTSPDASRSRNDIYIDGSEDYSPNSAWSFAAVEWVYSNEVRTAGGTDRYNPEVVDVSLLPYVSTVSSKQTSLTETSEWLAYKEAFDPMNNFQASGNWTVNPVYSIQLDSQFIGLGGGGVGYEWEIAYQGDCWRVTFKNNPSELSWHGFHTALKMITPDADSVYSAIYEACYYDNQVSDNPNTWFTYGSTELSGEANGYTYFYFR